MIFLKTSPAVLTKEIKYIYFLRSEHRCEIPQKHTHLPDGTFELIFNFGEPVFHFEDGRLRKRPNVIFIGGFKKVFHVVYSKNACLIGVVFNPGYVSHIVKDRLDHRNEIFVPAHEIFGSEIDLLAEQLHALDDFGQIRTKLEGYFLRIVSCNPNYQTERIAHAVALMLNRQGKYSLDSISDQVCMSNRNFRRVFGETTGYPPREWSRIIRAKRMIHCIKKGLSMRKHATLLGYYDASHVIRDFHDLCGMTPLAYVNQLNQIDLSFFRTSEYKNV